MLIAACSLQNEPSARLVLAPDGNNETRLHHAGVSDT
jgi:hypothetical protein